MTNSTAKLPTIPSEISIKEFLTKIFASSILFSWKLLAINRDTPTGIPIVAIVEKIMDIETTADEVPMISGVAILLRVIHRRYPESNATSDSINMKAAPFPTVCPLNSLHLKSLTIVPL